MKLLPAFVITLLAIAAAVPSRDYAIRAVPMTAVTIDDQFWAPKLEINRTVTIPHILKENDDTGRVANFEKAARRKSGPYEGRRFNDTDIYKIIEAASYSLALVPDPRLSTKLDELIQLIAESQEKDGYLFPARTIDPEHPAPGVGPERWIYENGSHELYNAGHLYEAAVAHFQATGKRSLLDVAIKNADLVCRTFGPNGRHAVPGHEEIELALVKLYRATGNATYLQTAEWFVAERGKPHPDMPPYPEKAFEMYNDRAYKQDQAPVVDQDSRRRPRRPRDVSLRGGHRRRGADRQRRVRQGRRSPLAGRRLEAAVSDRRRRRARHHRIVRRRLRAAEPARLHRDLRVGRQRSVEPQDVPAPRRRQVHRSARAHPLQRRARRRVAGRQHVLLSEPARVERPREADGVLRGRLLPGEPGAPARAGARPRLRADRRDDLREPLRRQSRDGDVGTRAIKIAEDTRYPVGRRRLVDARPGRLRRRSRSRCGFPAGRAISRCRAISTRFADKGGESRRPCRCAAATRSRSACRSTSATATSASSATGSAATPSISRCRCRPAASSRTRA